MIQAIQVMMLRESRAPSAQQQHHVHSSSDSNAGTDFGSSGDKLFAAGVTNDVRACKREIRWESRSQLQQ
ncbi:hypothetical protein ACLKA6_002029 [Drosophila palustris]